MSDIEACYIRLHRNRVKKQQRVIVDQLITKSRYPAMDRNERRTFEYYADEIAQLRAQAKDLKKARVVAQRIGVVIERIRKELEAIKQHLSDYNFVSTDGMDTKTGDDGVDYTAYVNACSDSDLTMDGSTRHAWIEQAKNMITCLRNFSLAQRLGNYTLLWNSSSGDFMTSALSGASMETCGGSAMTAHLQYRKEFLYMQYSTQCRTVAGVAEDEQDPAATPPVGSGIALEQHTSKKFHNYFSVSNPDLAINNLFKQLVCQGAVDLVTNTDNSSTPDGNEDADKSAVNLDNVDDERDVSCILKVVIDKLDDVMHAQQDNDNEQAALECAQDVNQQNLCWHEGVCAEMSEVDEVALKSKHANGEAILSDLTDLFKKASSKRDYFNCVQLTSKGSSWF